MDKPEVKAFNAELSGLYENKPPISKAKMSAITRGAIKAIKFYKHVVHSVEKFIQKCKPEYKVPGLYVIDSIVRQSRHQFGQDKDVFASRFAKNMQQTFANLFRCPPEDKRNIIRVLNLWQKNNVFSSQVIQPLLNMADPNHPLHQEIQQQQNNTANGSSMNISHDMSDSKRSPTPPMQHTPDASSPMGDQFQDESSNQGVKFNRKLLNDFEYDSEDEPPPQESTTQHPPHSGHQNTHSGHQNTHYGHQSQPQQHPGQNPTDALGSILTNPEIMRQLQSLQAQMQLMTGMQIPNLMPMMSDMQMQQNQNPYMTAPPDQHKQTESKDDMMESDIEFVETGPQVIEIPDANDSRSGSPKGRRHRSRSKSPRRRRRDRERSPKRRRDRDRDRDKDKDREKDKEKSYKEKEAEREKQREREKKGLPPIKKDNLSVCSTTLWVGHLSKLTRAEELWDLFGAIGVVASIDLVPPRGCAFIVMERRRDAHRAKDALHHHRLHSKEITVAWAPGKGVKDREWKEYWEGELGVSYLPWEALQARWTLGVLSLDALEDGGAVDEDTLPPWMPPRIIPKPMMEMPMMAGMPAVSGPGMMANLPPGAMPNLPPGLANLPPGALTNMPTGTLPNMAPGSLPNMPPGSLPSLPPGAMPPVSMAGVTGMGGAALSLAGALPTAAQPNIMSVPRMPPPGMTAGLPPGLTAGMPPGMRPPSLPTSVTGLQGEAGLAPAGPMLRFPPGMPHQSVPQPGMVGGFLGGLLGVGGLVGSVGLPLHHVPMGAASLPVPPQQATTVTMQQVTEMRPSEVNQSDDAMELDTEESHPDESSTVDGPPQDSATSSMSMMGLLSNQIQALLSQPPPNFNSSEPPPGFKSAEPPPASNPAEEKHEDERKNDRERDRRDRGDRDRDRERRDRDRRDRDRRDRDRGRDRDRERDDRRDRDRERGRDRRDRDRERDKDRDRFSTRDNNRERSREKSPRNNNNAPLNADNEKSLQERLWEMANGKSNSNRTDGEKPREDLQENRDNHEESRDENRMDRPPPLIDRSVRHDQPNMTEGDVNKPPTVGDTGWTQLPPQRQPPPHMAPHFRAGPWMEGPGAFGPRFNGIGPPPFNRPPFERPPFEGGPLFEGMPRFERPPFNRMPFDMNRPPFDGPRPPFDGLRPPFDGPRPPFDGSRPPFDGPRPPFDGQRPPFDGSRPPFDGPRPPFDGPRPPFDGPRPPFDGPRPPFDGPRPPFDGPRPPFDGPRPQFDGARQSFDGPRPPFEGSRTFEGDRSFEGPPRFDGPPEFYDRNNRRFDDREQYNDRNWNGDRERDWDRRNEWDDRRRDRRSREHEDRFRDRNERRRNFDERSGQDRRSGPSHRDERSFLTKEDRSSAKDDRASVPIEDKVPEAKEERSSRRDRDRKSRWGAAEEPTNQNDQENVLESSNARTEITTEAFAEYSSKFNEPFDTSHEQTSNDMNSEIIKNTVQSEQNIDTSPVSKMIDTDANEQRSIEQNNEQNNPTIAINEPMEAENIDESSTNLYDDNDTVDTSFSAAIPSPEHTEIPVNDMVDEVTNPDILNQDARTQENFESENSMKELKSVDDKDGAA